MKSSEGRLVTRKAVHVFSGAMPANKYNYKNASSRSFYSRMVCSGLELTKLAIKYVNSDGESNIRIYNVCIEYHLTVCPVRGSVSERIRSFLWSQFTMIALVITAGVLRLSRSASSQ